MDAKLKLYYFNLRGLAEHIRQLLALTGVPYENVIVDAETWPALKDGRGNCFFIYLDLFNALNFII